MHEKIHYNLMVDVFYFYYGYKPTDNQIIKCINGDIFDLDTNNLVSLDT